MELAKLTGDLLFGVAIAFTAMLAISTEAGTLRGCEVSPPRTDGKTIWDLAGSGLITGPLPALGEFAARTLGFGGRALEMAQARIYVRTLNRELEAFFRGGPCTRDDPESNSEDPILTPLLWDNGAAFQNRKLGIVDALEFSPQMDKHELKAVKTLVSKLMPTPLESPEQIRTFIRENPSGTRFIALNKSASDAPDPIIEAAQKRALSLGAEVDFCLGNVCVYKAN